LTDKQKRSPMKPVSETMRGWGEGLREELEQWPGVRVARNFGMVWVYRGDVVFAALPYTLALYAEEAIMLKFQEEKPVLAKRMAADPHFIATPVGSARNPKSEGHKWRFFMLRGDADVHAAIEWLAEAYQMARKRRK
jgi:hypothetical protein